eukprot:TRINITY_DN81650_c0_g1_i1.p1 TRINITY_DN81650_c0_g1~~TRINITY_DN81650_c0_g1_i1.p1  ORF type:complete len:491 (+),score=160.72 TRINITY_DN81650_c0_g1_i1:146-1618(+)
MEDIDLSVEEKIHSPTVQSSVGFRKDIDVTIIEVDKQESHYEYTIRAVFTSTGRETSSQKRFKEFVVFREDLMQECPFVIIPGLPNKDSLKMFAAKVVSSLDKREVHEHRLRELTRFLQFCAQHPILSETNTFLAFVGSETTREPVSKQKPKLSQKMKEATIRPSSIALPGWMSPLKEIAKQMEFSLGVLFERIRSINRRISVLTEQWVTVGDAFVGVGEGLSLNTSPDGLSQSFVDFGKQLMGSREISGEQFVLDGERLEDDTLFFCRMYRSVLHNIDEYVSLRIRHRAAEKEYEKRLAKKGEEDPEVSTFATQVAETKGKTDVFEEYFRNDVERFHILKESALHELMLRFAKFHSKFQEMMLDLWKECIGGIENARIDRHVAPAHVPIPTPEHSTESSVPPAGGFGVSLRPQELAAEDMDHREDEHDAHGQKDADDEEEAMGNGAQEDYESDSADVEVDVDEDDSDEGEDDEDPFPPKKQAQPADPFA